MKYNYKPKNKLEKFGFKIYNLLVENFPQTFFVGGMVRDLLLHKKITDIDIATAAAPDDVIRLLSANNILFDAGAQKFGAVIASNKSERVEVTTLRTEHYQGSRFPKVSFTTDPKLDSKRRDFGVNSLYLSANKGIIYDYQSGLQQLRKRTLKFIGNPQRRVAEDPLRIVRALRFALALNFKLEKNSLRAIKNNLNLLKLVNQKRIEAEIGKLSDKALRQKIKTFLDKPKALDKFQ